MSWLRIGWCRFSWGSIAAACTQSDCHRAATVRERTLLMPAFGRTLIFLGAILIVIGLMITFGERLPFRIGRLPGDIVIRGKNSVFYFPLATSLLLSLLLSVILWLINRR